jgi:hypothetical protein
MNMLSTSTLFLIIALFYGVFIVRDFYKNDKQYSLQAKIWTAIVSIFLLVGLLV